jgi:hypothetical protein
MWMTIPYLLAVLACLYGPFVGDLWVGIRGPILLDAGIPLALVTTTQLAFHQRLCRSRAWGAVLGLSWMSGCALVCLPGAWPDDSLTRAVVVGGLLVLAATGVILGAALGALRDLALHRAVRVLYGLAVLGVALVFLRTGLRLISSVEGGPIADTPQHAELFRRVVSGLAGLFLVSGSAEWGIARRRRTSA